MAEILEHGKGAIRVAKCRYCGASMAYLPKDIKTQYMNVITKYITCPDCESDVEVKETDEFYEDYQVRKAVE